MLPPVARELVGCVVDLQVNGRLRRPHLTERALLPGLIACEGVSATCINRHY